MKNIFIKLYIVLCIVYFVFYKTLYCKYIIFFFSKIVDENNCRLKTKRLNFAGNSIMELRWKIFPKVSRILFLFTLSFHDTFVRIFYSQRARNWGKRLKGISRSRSTIYYRSNRGNIFFSRINVNTRW